ARRSRPPEAADAARRTPRRRSVAPRQAAAAAAAAADGRAAARLGTRRARTPAPDRAACCARLRHRLRHVSESGRGAGRGGQAVTSEASIVVVLVTASGLEEARRIGRALVDERLAACANVVGPITSIFRWEGRVQEEAEHLLLVKARRADVERLT